jgi:hypothetical protein
MTLSLPRSSQLATAVLAAAWTIASFGAVIAPAPAEAASTTPFYRAQLASPAAERTTIADGVLWYCDGADCAAIKNRSKPWVTCKRLAKELGEVTQFTAGGKPLSAEEMEKCNAR